MDFKKLTTILVTLALLGVPLIVIFAPAILASTPAVYVIIVSLILGVIIQYASDQRVKDAVEEFKHWKIFDYLTTFLFVFGPLIIAYQTTIMGYVPSWAAGFATIAFGALSLYISERRAQAATDAPVPLEHDDA